MISELSDCGPFQIIEHYAYEEEKRREERRGGERRGGERRRGESGMRRREVVLRKRKDGGKKRMKGKREQGGMREEVGRLRKAKNGERDRDILTERMFIIRLIRKRKRTSNTLPNIEMNGKQHDENFL
jgi:hypothetical protein